MNLKMWKILLITKFFITSTYAAELHCSSFTAAGSCIIDFISNVTAPDEKVTVIGKPSTYTDPLGLNIPLTASSQFDFVPTDLFNIFPKVKMISMAGTILNYMVTDAFNHCPELTDIIGYNLQFFTLPAGFAQNCVKMSQITITGGLLRTLDPDALKGLSLLKSFIFSSNKITCVPPNFFSYTPNLDTLDLSYNKITAFDPMTFKGLSVISNLNFQMNKVTYIPNFDFNNTSTSVNILFMDIGVNPINAIDPKWVPALFNLRKGMKTNVAFSTDAITLSSCAPDSFTQINDANYNNLSFPLGTCYSNWSPTLVVPVPCAPKTTTSSTTTQAPTTQASNNPGLTTAASNQGNNPTCCQNGVLQVILQAFRNMTFDVKFN